MKLSGVGFLIEVALFVGSGYLLGNGSFLGFFVIFLFGVGVALLTGKMIEKEKVGETLE